MRFHVVSLFPEMFAAISEHGISRRALEQGLWSLRSWNPRDFTTDAHRSVDDRPYGGGPGMVMMAEPLALAVEAAKVAVGSKPRVISLAPNGRPLTDARVRELAREADAYVIVCGRYEGIDQRFIDTYVDETLSLGDFVMSGGELAAMALIDAIVRQLPGALKEASAQDESFAQGLLDGQHYTRPDVWRGVAIPDVLMSGHHADIKHWRHEAALRTTARQRPDLIASARHQGLLTAGDEKFLREMAQSGATCQG